MTGVEFPLRFRLFRTAAGRRVGLALIGLALAAGAAFSFTADSTSADAAGDESAEQCDKSLVGAAAAACAGMMTGYQPGQLQAPPVNTNQTNGERKLASGVYTANAVLSGGAGALSMTASSQCFSSISNCKSICDTRIEDCEACNTECKKHFQNRNTSTAPFNPNGPCLNCSLTSSIDSTGDCDKKTNSQIRKAEILIKQCKAHKGKGAMALAQGLAGLGQAALSMYAANLLRGDPKKPEEKDPSKEKERPPDLMPNPLSAAPLTGSSGSDYSATDESPEGSFNPGSFASLTGEGHPAASGKEEEDSEPQSADDLLAKNPRPSIGSLSGSPSHSGSRAATSSGSKPSSSPKAGFARARLDDMNFPDRAAKAYRSPKGGSFTGGGSSGGSGSYGASSGGSRGSMRLARLKKNRLSSRQPSSLKRRLSSRGGRHINIFEKASRIIQSFCAEGKEKCE